MSTHNICFIEKLRKLFLNYFQIASLSVSMNYECFTYYLQVYKRRKTSKYVRLNLSKLVVT